MDSYVQGQIVKTPLLKQNEKKKFEMIFRADTDDCHAVGQTPITYIRQILALIFYPKMFDRSDFPEDVKKLARRILSECKGSSVGSYSDGTGMEFVRRECANYIANRDGFETNWEDIILCDGSSDAIRTVFKILNGDMIGKKAGILAPIPRDPVYTAIASNINIPLIGYYLDETNDWSVNINELNRAIGVAKYHCIPKSIIIVNPGSPTGNVLSRKNIEDIIKFSYKNRLFLIVDEAYQHNVYDPNYEFYSFKKVLMEMGQPYNQMELASIMSFSTGYISECGLRTGYIELLNLDPEVKAKIYNTLIIVLHPNITGQATTYCAISPPKEGDPSYTLFIKERDSILESFKVRAKMVNEFFNRCKGISCNVVRGTTFAFPNIKIPAKAVKKAQLLNTSPCSYYINQLFENTGIAVIPGEAFGQVEGTYHFRMNMLSKTEELRSMLNGFKTFHEKFMDEYK